MYYRSVCMSVCMYIINILNETKVTQKEYGDFQISQYRIFVYVLHIYLHISFSVVIFQMSRIIGSWFKHGLISFTTAGIHKSLKKKKTLKEILSIVVSTSATPSRLKFKQRTVQTKVLSVFCRIVRT